MEAKGARVSSNATCYSLDASDSDAHGSKLWSVSLGSRGKSRGSGIDAEMFACESPLVLISPISARNAEPLRRNGADAISPASCANVYAATFSVDWQPSGAAAGPAIGPASRQSGSVADRLLREPAEAGEVGEAGGWADAWTLLHCQTSASRSMLGVV